jgi:glutaredoxin-related protein
MSAIFIQQQQLRSKIKTQLASEIKDDTLIEKRIPSKLSVLYEPEDIDYDQDQHQDENENENEHEDQEEENDSDTDNSSTSSEDLDILDSFAKADTYYFLDKHEGALQYDMNEVCSKYTDITKALTVNLCAYEVRMDHKTPFLLYLVQQEGTKFTFPQFPFRCPTNIQIEDNDTSDSELGPVHVYFKNECNKMILDIMNLDGHTDADALSDIYKGYVQDKVDPSIVYAFFDVSRFQIRGDKETKRVWASMDELYYCRQVFGIPVRQSVVDFLEETPAAMFVKNQDREDIEIPTTLYLCELSELGYYVNSYSVEEDEPSDQSLSLIDDRIDHPILGNFYYFTTDPLEYTSPSIFTIRRFTVLLEDPLYVVHPLTEIVHKATANKNVLTKTSSALETTFPNGAGSIIPNIVSYLSKSKVDASNILVDSSMNSIIDASNISLSAESKIQELIKEHDIVVFMDPLCPYSKEAIQLLTKHEIQYFVVECDSAMRDELKKITTVSSVPYIWMKEVYVGGLNNGPEDWMGIKPIIERGDLAKRLAAGPPLDLEKANEDVLHVEEEADMSIEEQVKELANVNNPCIYFQEVVGQKRIPFWCIKSKQYFSEI